MRLVRVQMTVLVEEYLGEGELQPLVVATLRDKRRQVQPAHPDVPVVLDRERPDPLRIRIPLRKPFQKGMRERRMPDHLPLQAPQKLLSIHPALLPEDLHQFNASSWYFSRSRRTDGSLQLLPARRPGHHLTLVEQRDGFVEKLFFGPRIPTTRKVFTLVVINFLHTHKPTPHTTPKGYKIATLQLKPNNQHASACGLRSTLRPFGLRLSARCLRQLVSTLQPTAVACQQRFGLSGLAFSQSSCGLTLSLTRTGADGRWVTELAETVRDD